MFKNSKIIFILLLILAGFLVVIDLPENYHVNFSVRGVTIDRVINPPNIDITILGKRIQKSFKTRLGLDLSGGTHIVLQADMSNINEDARIDALESAKEIIERRVNFFGLTEPLVQTSQTQDTYRIIVEMPGITNVDQAVQAIGQTAKLEFREFLDENEATEAATIEQMLAATQSVDITGKDLQRAQISFSQQTGESQVAIEFTKEGGDKFAETTKRLVGKPLGIFLDDIPISSPMVQQEIIGGSAVISGSFTVESAKILALQLNAGALPVPVDVVEQKVIGATLGQESVEKSIRAGAVGLAIVAVYMIATYGKLGLLADFALILYGLITFAIFRLIPVTLTLPGIAGFILSVGMAVDSNILIFERYKEETLKGKPWKIAMELGFGKAWESIKDANFTTLITCAVLYNPGNWSFLPASGMVRGFAITLFIGVLVGLFTGIVVTRTLIRVLYKQF
ncbi:protein translocase subunit SecD [Patescibacteria group bacterium]